VALPNIGETSIADETLNACVEYNAQLQGWADVGQITELNCQDNTEEYCSVGDSCIIGSLAGIEEFNALEVLKIANNNVNDLSPLSELLRLELLDLGDTEPDDLSPVVDVDDVRITPLIAFITTGPYRVVERGQIEIEVQVTARAPNAALNSSDVSWILISGQASLNDVVGTTLFLNAPSLGDGVDDEVVTYTVRAMDSNGNIANANAAIDVYAYLPLSGIDLDDSEFARCVEDAGIAHDWQDVGQVTELDCIGYEILALDQAVDFPILNLLAVSGDLSITPLLNINTLNRLVLQSNDIIDFNGLSNMTQLTELTISNITDYSELYRLESLPAVRALHLMDIEFSNSASLPNFSAFVALTELNLSRNLLEEIDDLLLPAGLESLDLSNNDLTELNVLVPYDDLESLYLSNNAHLTYADVEILDHFSAALITDFPFFMMMQASEDQLADTALRNCVFETGLVSGWSRVEDYESIECIDEGIVSVYGLEFYSYLQELTLAENALIEFDVGGAMPNLTTVNVEENEFNSLVGLNQLESLSYLNLSNNELINLNGIEDLDSLKGLTIRDNAVTSLEGVEALLLLEKLNAGNNSISDLPNLGSLDQLSVLWLGSNNIDNDDLFNIGTAPGALELILDDNIAITELDGLYGAITLNRIYLRGIGLSCQELDDLRAAISGLDIFYGGVCSQ